MLYAVLRMPDYCAGTNAYDESDDRMKTRLKALSPTGITHSKSARLGGTKMSQTMCVVRDVKRLFRAVVSFGSHVCD